MSQHILNETRNELTEVYKRYKLLSTNLQYCYCRLPNVLSKIATYLFTNILDSKFYTKDDKSNIKGSHEEKRIYTDCDISIEDIILNVLEYDTNVAGSSSNIIKYIKRLQDMNVFYFWKFKGKYIFIMEREIGCWKFYNEYGVVIPRTLKKILDLSQYMVECMRGFHTIKGAFASDEESIELSLGEFINSMIDKMNPSVAGRIKRYDKSVGLSGYVMQTYEELDKMDKYEGLEEHSEFLEKLPRVVGDELASKRKIGVNAMKKPLVSDMENELVPSNPNLGRKKRGRPPKKKDVTAVAETKGEKEGIKAESTGFYETIDPFKDSKSFVQYYRTYLRSHDNKMVFEPFASDAETAASILDLMLDNSMNNKQFLDSWLNYYIENALKGERVTKTKHTSLKTFKLTFEKFMPRYFIPSII